MTETLLPVINDGESLQIVQLSALTKETKAPVMFTEGTLIAAMESPAKFITGNSDLRKVANETGGLGTAATRDACIEGLKADKYLVVTGKQIDSTEKGDLLIEWLEANYPDLTDVALTAAWEQELATVAIKGGGRNFEQKINEKIRGLVATLKTAPPLRGGSLTNLENQSMSDTGENRISPPTSKMLDFAKNIATRINQRIPEEVMTNFEKCKEYIDKNKDAANQPSPKQLTFATSIAGRKGLTIPPETLANGKELSAWIDANK